MGSSMYFPPWKDLISYLNARKYNTASIESKTLPDPDCRFRSQSLVSGLVTPPRRRRRNLIHRLREDRSDHGFKLFFFRRTLEGCG